MSQLTVRSPKFHIDETVPFQWQPANPSFGLFGNVFTFLAIAFERYIVSATRQAEPRFTNAAVAEEADLFVRQEAQHARAHRAHAKAMIAQYPGLEGTYAAANAAYDELLEREDVEFHLAYVACLEATFTPLFKMVLDHRRSVVRGQRRTGRDDVAMALCRGDRAPQLGSGDPPRCDTGPVVSGPQGAQGPRACLSDLQARSGGFEEHVPLEDRLISTQLVSPSGLYLSELRDRFGLRGGLGNYPSMLGHVPGRDLGTMLWRETKGQMPRHDPAHEPLPAWAERWHEAFNSGADVTTYEGVGALT